MSPPVREHRHEVAPGVAAGALSGGRWTSTTATAALADANRRAVASQIPDDPPGVELGSPQQVAFLASAIPGKIVANGFNYNMDHIWDSETDSPKARIAFAKVPSIAIDDGATIVLASQLKRQGDWEVERIGASCNLVVTI